MDPNSTGNLVQNSQNSFIDPNKNRTNDALQSAKIQEWPDGLTRDIISIGKFRLQSYLRKPSVITSSKSAFRVVSHCTLKLFYDVRNGKSMNELSFKIGLRNYGAVLRFFQHIYDWFTSDAYANLFFLEPETGRLMLDMDMRNIKEHIGGDSRYDQCAMEAVPAIYQRDQEIREGCVLTINNTANSDVLRDMDIETLFQVLKNFSFQSEALLLMTAFNQKELWETEQKRFGFSHSNGGNVQPKVIW